MDPYKELQERLKSVGGNSRTITIWQGIVNSIDGVTCEVQVGNIAIPGVRLRASESQSDNAMIIVPKVGTAVTIGSLSGDLSMLVVLKVDEVESITINGGKLGGMVNVDALTNALNKLVSTFNNHMHTVPNGTSSAPVIQASSFSKGDYEDLTIKH